MKRWLVAALLCGSGAVACGAEQRVALVIGNAAYRSDALDNPVHDARLVAASLEKAGFDVTLAENADRRGLLGALRSFGQRLNEDSVAVLYYAGHGLQLRDRNYLIPVDAEIKSEDEIPLAGIDIGFVLSRMSAARSRVNIVVLDACRNNPFAASSGKPASTLAQGLAQMDAPVGTLLAYATAPGKLAADNLGGPGEKHGLYAQQLARHLLTPGLPVEHVFKRVREAVVRASREAQVPWESSSLQGEFAFVAGAPDSRVASGAAPAAGAARAEAVAAAAPVAATPSTASLSSRLAGLPRAGDSWRYRVQDRHRLGDLIVSTKVESVGDQGVTETRTSSVDARPRSARVALAPSFANPQDAAPAPAEFAPYLQAGGAIAAALRGVEIVQQVEQASVPLRASVEGEEEVQVAAGRFRAQKVLLRGQAQARGTARSGAVVVEHRLWYANEARRVVRHEIHITIGGTVHQATSVELIEYQVQ